MTDLLSFHTTATSPTKGSDFFPGNPPKFIGGNSIRITVVCVPKLWIEPVDRKIEKLTKSVAVESPEDRSSRQASQIAG